MQNATLRPIYSGGFMYLLLMIIYRLAVALAWSWAVVQEQAEQLSLYDDLNSELDDLEALFDEIDAML
jgi:hypothetical protein